MKDKIYFNKKVLNLKLWNLEFEILRARLVDCNRHYNVIDILMV